VSFVKIGSVTVILKVVNDFLPVLRDLLTNANGIQDRFPHNTVEQLSVS
jgi:hypothetical protein